MFDKSQDAMKYIDVRWLHSNVSEPVRLVSELDDERFETRKLEFFRRGVVGLASSSASAGGTRLGKSPVPSLEDVNADPQFRGVEMEASQFEALWRRYSSPEGTD